MKAALLLISVYCIFIFAQCAHHDSTAQSISIKKDSIYKAEQSSIKLLVAQDYQCQDSLRFFHKQNDSLRTQLFLVNYKVEKIKFYLNLCTKNSSQDKFLKGWIRRAVE